MLRGRPRLTFVETIRRDVRVNGVEEEDIQDREKWRARSRSR